MLAFGIVILLGSIVLTVYTRRVVLAHAVVEPARGEGTAPVTVVVAARNEAPRIARLIASLRAQDHPAWDAVFVDDRSTDQTARAIEEAAGNDSRFRTLAVASRPLGWQGRLHAQDLGARQATGKWLIFLSADQELRSPTFLRSMVAQYERGPDEAISVIGPFAGTDWWHRFWFLPIFNNPILWGVILLIQDRLPTRSWLIGALGLRRERFSEIGGGRAAATCAAGGFDDFGWSRVFANLGVRTRMVYHPALLDYSNWTSFELFWEAIRRWMVGLFTYHRGGWWVASGLGLYIGFLVLTLGSVLLTLLEGGVPPPWAIAVSGVGPALGLGYSHWTQEKWWFPLVFPVVGIFLLTSLMGAAWTRLRNRVSWRGELMLIVAAPPPTEDETSDCDEKA